MLNIILKNINLSTDPGIEADIRGFFRDNDQINGYDYFISENIYNINIDIKNKNRQFIAKIFHSFLQFIEYDEWTYYIRHEYENKTTYEIVTSVSSDAGFYFRLNIA